jgi:hypothetical protein
VVWRPCYHTHLPLPLGGDLVIYGGSCVRRTIEDADIYIGFDAGMQLLDRSTGWTSAQQVLYAIPDQRAPRNPETFRKLVEWTAEQLRAGKKVHAGCLGGHGRTGTFFAALVAHMLPEVEDPIAYVREHYCRQAVETEEQVEFLTKEFGMG